MISKPTQSLSEIKSETEQLDSSSKLTPYLVWLQGWFRDGTWNAEDVPDEYERDVDSVNWWTALGYVGLFFMMHALVLYVWVQEIYYLEAMGGFLLYYIGIVRRSF